MPGLQVYEPGDQSQASVHTRQAVYQLSHMLSGTLFLIKTQGNYISPGDTTFVDATVKKLSEKLYRDALIVKFKAENGF